MNIPSCRKVLLLFMILMMASSAGQAAADDEAGRKGELEEVQRLGREFQEQMPGKRLPVQRGYGYPVLPQPYEYSATPERELPGRRDDYENRYWYDYDYGYDYYSFAPDYPLCYDPYRRRYEYCDPGDSYYFDLRMRSPEFRLWWGQERFCPPGFFFMRDRGCMRR